MTMNDENMPYAKIGEFAALEVVSLQPIGAFLDWGLDKDLFLPFREQTRSLRVGDTVVVYVYLDNVSRACASMRLDKYIDQGPGDYYEGDAVDLLIVQETDIGYKAIIDGRYYGVLYRDEVFQSLERGERIDGFIKKVRPDGKIDLSLHQTGHKDADHIGQSILRLLEKEGEFLPVNDKTSAEVIYDLFGVSKKKFKMAIGGLYKKKLITIEEDGIRWSGAL